MKSKYMLVNAENNIVREASMTAESAASLNKFYDKHQSGYRWIAVLR